MQTGELANPQTIDTILRYLSWAVIGFGAVWLVTGTIGYFQRRAYNLTHAESGGSKNIKPDFLKVDEAKRKAAIERGAAYDTVLAERAAPTAVETVSFWSRLGAGSSAILALVALIVGTLTKIQTLQTGVDQFTSWDRFAALVAENKAGTVVAFIVIAANVIVFAEGSRKWGRMKTSAK